MEQEESYHWADLTAEKIIRERGNKDKYVCAAGITPSGVVHIGNFREIITVDLVCRALRDKGKKVRFIYSWDDYDRLRKVPKNMPHPEVLEKYIGKPVVDTPDTFGCHKSYAEHFEKDVETNLPSVGIHPEFIQQHKKYRACEYAEMMKYALKHREKIREVLNKYREEHHEQDWYPLGIFCEKCGTDNTKVLKYDGNHTVTYECDCGFSDTIDFSKKGIVKLNWRADWPCRQHHEKVDFEPAGKEHYAQPGGSRITANEIYDAIFDDKHPVDLKYDFITVKGQGGKMSSSLGNVITLKECLEVYEPDIIRYLFASTRPNVEFAISFDLDVIKIYEDYDKTERVYFEEETEENKKAYLKERRIYEFSQVEKVPDKMPLQVPFRHLTNLVQVYEGDIKKVVEEYKTFIKDDLDKKKLETRALCAWNWVQKYAPEDMKFKVHEKVSEAIKSMLSDDQKKAIKILKDKLKHNKYDEGTLFNEFYTICQELSLDNKVFFKGVYLTLIGKERGPKLAGFILTIGVKKTISLLEEA
ncbi:lysine--tRNA ligase [Candidatus Woesearchaeota archaeon]|nr:lysine--tRNA ligase [Candidatus Woesearchaeota archaeon]